MSVSLHARSITLSRGARVLIEGSSLTLATGDRVGLVGPNGVGKSSLLSALAGELPVDSGTIEASTPGATVGWLRQEPDRSAASVREFIAERTGATSAQRELDDATLLLAAGEPGCDDRYNLALEHWLRLGVADLEARTGDVADDLRLPARTLDQPMASLSGGEAGRACLAALLLSRFDAYLLDEPTNDLDLAGLERLEDWMLDQRAGVLFVSHDRRFLERVATDVVELDEFTHHLSRFRGGWGSYQREREVARQHAWQQFEDYDTKRRGLVDRAQREREWASQGLSKVNKSGEPDKHIRAFKVNQTEQLAGRAARTARAADRLEQVEKPREPWQLRFSIAATPRSGDVVSRLIGATAQRGAFHLGPIDLLVAFGDRIAVTGPNGAGKTTLLHLILGRIEPEAGSAELGSGVVIGELTQLRSQLQGDSLLRAFMDVTTLTVPDARTLLAKFGLVGDHVERPTASLSPGERTRAALALFMASGANLLVLDEPTNHLDLPAIEQLEQALDAYDGTLLLVTHDRALLEAVRLTRTIEL